MKQDMMWWQWHQLVDKLIRWLAPRSRQITTPAPHRSVFRGRGALPDAQPTVSKHCRRMTSNAVRTILTPIPQKA